MEEPLPPPHQHRFRSHLFVDLICPWCFIGWRNLLQADLPPTQIVWRIFQLNPTMPAQGIDRQTYLTKKFGDQAASFYARIAEAGKNIGIDFAFDAITHTPNSLAAHRLVLQSIAAGDSDKTMAVIESMYSAYFLEGLNIGNAGVLARIAEEHAVPLGGGEVARLDEAQHAGDIPAMPGKPPTNGTKEFDRVFAARVEADQQTSGRISVLGVPALFVRWDAPPSNTGGKGDGKGSSSSSSSSMPPAAALRAPLHPSSSDTLSHTFCAHIDRVDDLDTDPASFAKASGAVPAPHLHATYDLVKKTAAQ